MSTIPGPAKGPSTPPHLRLTAGGDPATPRAPEWPRLTRNEVRQIVLDILG